MLIDTLDTFYYNGRSLSDIGAVIKQKPKQVFSLPDFNLVEMPFRNGDEIEDNIRYKNVAFKIPIIALPAFCSLTRSEFSYMLIDWLLSGDRGYKIYRDSYNKGYFRYGIVTNIEPVEEVERGVYETEITISFKPFLYSYVGANPLEFSITDTAISTWMKTLINPENWDSEPIITVKGSGKFKVDVITTPSQLGTVTVDATSLPGFTIDKQAEDVYTLTGVPCNQFVSGLRLPKFMPGRNVVAITRSSGSGTWKVEITPNWRRL